MRIICLLPCALIACLPPAAEQRESASSIDRRPALEIGGLTLGPDARVQSLRLPSGTPLPVVQYSPFLLAGAPADALEVLSNDGTHARVRLTSPGSPATVELAIDADAQGLLFNVLSVEEPPSFAATHFFFDVRFIMPEDFECLLGYVGYTPGSHVCSSAYGTLAAFCLTGNCDNRTKHHLPSASADPVVRGSELGASLMGTSIDPLAVGGVALMMSDHPAASALFDAEAKQFEERFGSSVGVESQLFLTTPPCAFDCGPSFDPGSAHRGAQLARALGFGELQLIDYTWLALGSPLSTLPSYGLFDPISDLHEVVAAIKDEGVCPMLHTVATLAAPQNAICGGDAESCAPAALRNPDGLPRRENGAFVIDTDRRDVRAGLIDSMTTGLNDAGACGMYADGSDWFFASFAAAGEYIHDYSTTAPSLRLRPNYLLPNAALWFEESETQDTWQIDSSVSPRDWALQYGYFELAGLLENVGLRGRLGWIPTPGEHISEADYQPMLNAGVATGSHITIETMGDDPTLSAPEYAWFQSALIGANRAVAEIRAGQAGRAYGHRAAASARHEVFHFDSGVSTIALFDGIVPAAPGTALEARGFGVVTSRGSQCGPFASCFYFSGAPRMPADFQDPRLTERGAYLYHPGDARTRTGEFTISAWFKPRPDQKRVVGSIFEKGLLGYGMAYDKDTFSGHLSGDAAGAYYGIARDIPDPTAWHHAAFSYSGSHPEFRFYIDGELSGPIEPTTLVPSPYASTPIYVGTAGVPIGNSNFGGWMNDVRMYDRVVSDEEMRAIYRGQLGGVAPLLAWSAGQVVPSAIIDVDLDQQRTVYLVPMLGGAALPPEHVRLTFRVRAPQRVHVESEVPYVIERALGDTLVIDIDSEGIGTRPVRLAIVES